ncbi:MAG: LysM domain-containing protein [Chloroflexota bacterium]
MKRLATTTMVALLLLAAFSVSSQETRRLNARDVLDLAVFCSGPNVDLLHIDAAGAGQPALFAAQNDINWGLLQARDTGGAYTIGTGNFGVTLIALPGIQLRAQQNFQDKAYTFDFAGDSCAPVNLPAGEPGFTGPTVTNPATTVTTTTTTSAAPTTTGTIQYTVQAGDSFYRIARRFSITIDELAAANGTIASDLIYPGQSLTIPGQVVEATTTETTTVIADPVGGITVDGSGNFLQDGSFEGFYTGRGASDLNIPSAWGFQVFTSPRTEAWQNLRPYAFPRRDPPIQSGGLSLNINRGYATFSVVLFQQVRVPANATLEAGAWAWYDTCDAGRSACDNNGNPNFRVGIDPNGGTNAFDGDIVWSPFIAPQGTWGATNISTRAQGDVVTMYISASQSAPRAINELYIDNAWLREQ